MQILTPLCLLILDSFSSGGEGAVSQGTIWCLVLMLRSHTDQNLISHFVLTAPVCWQSNHPDRNISHENCLTDGPALLSVESDVVMT